MAAGKRNRDLKTEDNINTSNYAGKRSTNIEWPFWYPYPERRFKITVTNTTNQQTINFQPNTAIKRGLYVRNEKRYRASH